MDDNKKVISWLSTRLSFWNYCFLVLSLRPTVDVNEYIGSSVENYHFSSHHKI